MNKNTIIYCSDCGEERTKEQHVSGYCKVHLALANFKLEQMNKCNQLIRPKLIENPDLTDLIDICMKSIIEHEEGEATDSNLPHYIYETAMQTFYGDDVFENYLNKFDT